ncbi:MAG: ribosome-binding factor A, partial [Armatimonadota bacterium]
MSLRQERVNKFLVQEISAIVRRMKDPRLGFVTFTEAHVSPDLRTAR